jgi:myo-inositol-1(or 4)-monophosphatase
VKESDVAVILARQAGEVILRAWDKPNIEIEQKGEINLVTAIDRHCEELILSGLEHDFPGYGILSEESPEQPASWPARWIIDPLDGTTNFIKKYPFVAVSIALEVEGALVSGVVYNPIADELFVAERGQGAKLNGMPVHPSAMTSLSRAVLASGFPYDAWTNPENNARQWSAFLKRTLSLRCDGSAALDLCHVACGRLDGYWEKGLNAWDVAAGALIAREAGGWVGDYRGSDDFISRREIVATNSQLAPEMLAIIQSS